jgi:sterol desaturase/sphingolipid hydroxylase (fatty acid hydroxylase superfamily)
VQLVAQLLMPVTFAAMVVAERLRPGRALPAVRGWLAKGSAWFAIACAGYAFVPAWVADRAPRYGLPEALAALAVFVLADAIAQVVHRGLHRVAWAWRWVHQLHHSAERIDVAAAMYRHPLDLALQLAALAVAVLAIGATPATAMLAAYLALATRLFAHVNVRTPQWLGWIVQRPEAHAVHHARGVHAYNYGTLTVWDLVLGTFRNPARFSSEPAGFWDGASREVGKMLVGRDVGEPDLSKG